MNTALKATDLPRRYAKQLSHKEKTTSLLRHKFKYSNYKRYMFPFKKWPFELDDVCNVCKKLWKEFHSQKKGNEIQ